MEWTDNDLQNSARMTLHWGQDGLTLAGYTGKIEKSAKLLDVACGIGRLAMAAAEMGFEVTATDLSERMLNHVKKQAAAASLNITTIESNAETLEGLPDNTFDVVTTTFGICHFGDRPAAWRSMLRVLKPGGRIILAAWKPQDQTPIGKYLMTHAVDYKGEVKENAAHAHDHGHGHANEHEHSHGQPQFPEKAVINHELSECGFVDTTFVTLRHDICFTTGKDATKMFVPDAINTDQARGKDSRSLKLCLMHYLDLFMQGIDPLLDEGAPLPPKSDDGVLAEEMPIWSNSVAAPVDAYVGIASKPF